MLEPWDDPGYVKRAWCLFELYTAIRLPSEVDIDIILSPKQRSAFRDAMVSGGYAVVDAALDQIHAESATASVETDLDAIRAVIRGFPGGFDTLNEVVKQRLRQWFEEHGGIKVVAHTHGFGAPLPQRGGTDIHRAMPTAHVSGDSQHRTSPDFQVGHRVTVSGYRSTGVIRFLGAVNTAPTHGKVWVGVELDTPDGKHAGVVDGQQYFSCPEKHGLLVPIAKVRLLATGEDAAGRPRDDPADIGFGFGRENHGDGDQAIATSFGFDSDQCPIPMLDSDV